MDRRTYLRTLGAAGAAAVAGCVSGSAEGEFDVGMTIRRYDPQTLEVTPGTTVVWKNTSGRAHTVTAYGDGLPDGADFFASGGYDTTDEAREAWIGGNGGALYEDETFEHTFETPGDHTYFCIPHEVGGMVGTVSVREE